MHPFINARPATAQQAHERRDTGVTANAFARISLHRGKPGDYLQALSQSLHAANQSRASKYRRQTAFQVIHQHEAGELIFRPSLPGRRTFDFLLIRKCCRAGTRYRDQQRFYRSLVQRLQRERVIDPRT